VHGLAGEPKLFEAKEQCDETHRSALLAGLCARSTPATQLVTSSVETLRGVIAPFSGSGTPTLDGRESGYSSIGDCVPGESLERNSDLRAA